MSSLTAIILTPETSGSGVSRLNGELIEEEVWRLDKELVPRTTMFLQLFVEDYSRARQGIEGDE